MSSWRAKASGLFRKWQLARDQSKQAKEIRQEQREAEELQRSRAGDRFPPMGG
jgi:hypothetical protein